MRALDRLSLETLLPIAATAGVIVFAPMILPASTVSVRFTPTQHRSVIAVPVPLPMSGSGSWQADGAFTSADMAVLNMVDRAAGFDDLDYTGLFDYDDD